MKTFTPKQKQTHKAKTADSMRSNRVFSTQRNKVSSILDLHSTNENQAVQLLFGHKSRYVGNLDSSVAPQSSHSFGKIPVHTGTHGNIQPKLKVNSPGDIYEQEADRVSNQIMENPVVAIPQSVQRLSHNEDEIIQNLPAPSITPIVQRQAPPGEKEKDEIEEDDSIGSVQPKRLQSAVSSNHEHVEDLGNRLKREKGGGKPMDADMRAFFEPRMQAGFDRVRIHTDSNAVHMNRELGARAFTHGRDIYFGADQYVPNSLEGKKLIAHELTHVVQQGGGQRSSMNTNQRSVGSDVVQRTPLAGLKAAEWIALGATGYVVAQDAVKSSAGDIKYTFDEMEGVLLPGGGNDVAEYRKKHPNTNIQTYTHQVATWLGYSGSRKMGIKFGITFNYDGHALGNISCSILDTYDWPMWGGNVSVNFTPMSLSKGGVSSVRITLNLGADVTIRGGVSGSRILYLDGTGTIRRTGTGAYVRFSKSFAQIMKDMGVKYP